MRLLLATLLAVAPSGVTVTQGTLVSGDAGSLAATDGNTLDVQAALVNGKYRADFTADYGNGFTHITLSYTAWTSGHAAKCVFWIGTPTPQTVKLSKRAVSSGTWNVGSWGTNVSYEPRVECKSNYAFTLHFDRLTVNE